MTMFILACCTIIRKQGMIETAEKSLWIQENGNFELLKLDV
jgi:hypothetical protein